MLASRLAVTMSSSPSSSTSASVRPRGDAPTAYDRENVKPVAPPRYTTTEFRAVDAAATSSQPSSLRSPTASTFSGAGAARSARGASSLPDSKSTGANRAGDDDIGMAVVIEVARRHALRLRARTRRSHTAHEATGAVAEPELHGPIVEARDNQVDSPVGVDVRGRDPARALCGHREIGARECRRCRGRAGSKSCCRWRSRPRGPGWRRD